MAKSKDTEKRFDTGPTDSIGEVPQEDTSKKSKTK